MDMFPITLKGSSYFVSGGEKDISFVVSTNKRAIGSCHCPKQIIQNWAKTYPA